MNALRRWTTPVVVSMIGLGSALTMRRLARGGWVGAGWTHRTLYDWSAVAMMVAVLLGAAVLVANAAWTSSVPPRIAGAASAAVTVAMAALAGAGATAVRRWYTSGGGSAHAKNERGLRVAAAVMAVTATIAVIAVCIDMWRTRRPARVVRAVTASVGAAVAIPFALGAEYSSIRTTSIGAHGLMYGIPVGLAVAAVIAGSSDAAWGASAVTAVYLMVAAVDEYPMIRAARWSLGITLAAVWVLAAWAIRLGGEAVARRPPSWRRSTLDVA